MIGVMATLGYRSEKNKLAAEPASEKRSERIHMRGANAWGLEP